MTDGKLNLPDDLLLSSKSADERLSSFKDQLTVDNTIPLSPQWLYAKPVDAKSLTAGASGVWSLICLKLDMRIDLFIFSYLYQGDMIFFCCYF